MARVMLHPLFAALKVAFAKGLSVVPGGVTKCRDAFHVWVRMIKCADVWAAAPFVVTPGVIVRTDAMAGPEGAFIGGWMAPSVEAFAAKDVSWFLFHVDQQLFPNPKAEANRVISACEALAVAVALFLWGPTVQQRSGAVASVVFDSDSMVTVHGSKRWYSPSANLACALGWIVDACIEAKVRPAIVHIAGDLNVMADAISRSGVDQRAATFVHSLPRARRRKEKLLPSGLRRFLDRVPVARVHA